MFIDNMIGGALKGAVNGLIGGGGERSAQTPGNTAPEINIDGDLVINQGGTGTNGQSPETCPGCSNLGNLTTDGFHGGGDSSTTPSFTVSFSQPTGTEAFA